MGTIKQGILGGFSGKIGTVIGGSWKGIDYMRSKASSISNPRTELQIDQRTRFAAVLKFLQPLTPFLKIGFKNYAVKMTAFNNAMSYNLQNAITGAFPDYSIDYSNALVTRGTLPGALNPEVTSTNPGQVEFSWQDNSEESTATATDATLIVIFNPAKQRAVTMIGSGMRSAGNQVVAVPASFAGDQVHCYVAFQNANQSVLSNSVYAGPVNVYD